MEYAILGLQKDELGNDTDVFRVRMFFKDESFVDKDFLVPVADTQEKMIEPDITTEKEKIIVEFPEKDIEK